MFEMFKKFEGFERFEMLFLFEMFVGLNYVETQNTSKFL